MARFQTSMLNTNAAFISRDVIVLFVDPDEDVFQQVSVQQALILRPLPSTGGLAVT